jgi:hypothetical protein
MTFRQQPDRLETPRRHRVLARLAPLLQRRNAQMTGNVSPARLPRFMAILSTSTKPRWESNPAESINRKPYKTAGRSAGALRGWRRDLRLSARAPCSGCRSMRCAHSLGLPCRKSGARGQARVGIRGRKKPRLRPYDAREGSSPNGRDRLARGGAPTGRV